MPIQAPDLPQPEQEIQAPSFREAFLFWLKLGFISFGGPAGQIAILHEYLVEKKKWISESRFLHALNYCMLLPGPEAQQLATYCGWLLHKTRGGLTAGILFILPSLLILWALALLYVNFGQTPVMTAIFSGLQPAVVAIIFVATLRIGKRTLKNLTAWTVAALSFAGLYFFHLPFPLIILAALATGFILQWLSKGKDEIQPDQTAEESGYYINSKNIPEHTKFSWRRLRKQSFVLLGLWFCPFVLFLLFAYPAHFWVSLSVFFTKAALVTFGGAYAVLPYVAEFSVQQAQWLSAGQMLDGLALGETTPGPLIMVLVFVGFLAGYHEYGFSLFAGSLAMLSTAWFTFLPSFYLIFAGAPLVEKTRADLKIRNALRIVTAAVVGVILNLAFYFGEHVLFPEGFIIPRFFPMIWIPVSILALYRFRIRMPLWIIFSGFCGWLVHALLK